jgi:hypothetical protein
VEILVEGTDTCTAVSASRGGSTAVADTAVEEDFFFLLLVLLPAAEEILFFDGGPTSTETGTGATTVNGTGGTIPIGKPTGTWGINPYETRRPRRISSVD